MNKDSLKAADILIKMRQTRGASLTLDEIVEIYPKSMIKEMLDDMAKRTVYPETWDEYFGYVRFRDGIKEWYSSL